MTTAHRDLSSLELWERSLARSRHRRALAPKVRREHKRRKRLSAAVAAATMAGPSTPMAMAQVAGDVQAEVAAATPSKRAIEVREGGLPLMLGSQGPLVAEVQKALGIPADGIFGGQTDAAVRGYQSRAGLQVDGIVGPATWSALVERAAAAGGWNVPQGVKDRLEAKLAEAGRQVATPAQSPSNGLFGDSGASEGEETDEAGSPADDGSESAGGGESGAGQVGDQPAPVQTGDAPADDQSDVPAAGGGQQTSTPVSGSCGSSTIASPVKGTVTSEFGPRWGRNHDGIDIAAPTGTAVRAAACGTVTVAGQQSGYGNMVCITHTSQFSTCYAHLSGFATSQGAQVRQGQVIGYVGCTGSCTGPHLHFETRVGGQARNPSGYLNGATIPGQAATTAKASSAGTGSATTSKGGGATATTAWKQAGTAAASETVTAGGQVTAQSAVGPTTPTAPPGSPEAMTTTAPAAPAPAPTAPAPAPAPAEAAPAPAPTEAAPLEAAPAPVESAPVGSAPAQPAPAPVEAAPVPVEAAPAPVEAAPAPVETAPAPVESAPAAPAPVEAAPVETAPAQPAAAPVEAAPAPAPADAAPAAPAPTPAATPAPAASAPAESAAASATPAPAAAADSAQPAPVESSDATAPVSGGVAAQ